MISVLLTFLNAEPGQSGDVVDDARVSLDVRPTDSAATFSRMLTAAARERCPRGYTVDEVGDLDDTKQSVVVYVYEG